MALPTTLTVLVVGVFFGIYGLILSDKFHKPSAAVLGATLMVGTGVLNETELFQAINWTALGVLLGMFIIASSLREAGFFEWMGLHLAHSVDTHPVLMYVLLPLLTAGMASLLDIVTVALFIVPLTVAVFDGLGIDPIPFVIAEVLAANVGGISTMVGDPTNVIIGTGIVPNLSFNQFLTNTGPIALAILALNGSILYLRNHGFLHKDALKRHRERKPLQLPSPASAVKDRGLLRVSIVSLGLAVGFLVVHTFLGVSAALATLLPSFIILVYESSRQSEVRDVLGRIDWQVFFFFGGLFILVAGFAKTGLLVSLGNWLVQQSGSNLAISVTLVLWTTALISQIVDNVPLVTVFIPVITTMAATTGIAIAPLAWALAVGTGIGGMATPIGTASNLVALNILNKDKKRISFARFAKRSIPLTILDLAIANIILLLRL
ncbi:MAG TPA: SLC13 family permease [Candidatus Bathyarchaeia archaeon]|nr:SLC13 family permease [Candidatus Bathyarchaeia archaeon]